VQVSGFEASTPVITSASIPASAKVGVPVQFTAAASDFWGPVSLSWIFGDGGSGSGSAVTHIFAAPASHTVTVTASDGVSDTATRTGAVTVTEGPVVSQVSETHSKFRVGSAPTAITANARESHVPVGTTFHYTLNEPARISIVIVPSAAGQTHQRCLRKAASHGRHGRCKAHVRKWTLTRSGHAGANAVAFSGRVGQTPLAPGHYTVTITAVASGLTSQTRRLSFTIVR
jgi:hypothetical protein